MRHSRSTPCGGHGYYGLRDLRSLLWTINRIEGHLRGVDAWSDGVDADGNAFESELCGHHFCKVRCGGFGGVVAELGFGWVSKHDTPISKA